MHGDRSVKQIFYLLFFLIVCAPIHGMEGIHYSFGFMTEPRMPILSKDERKAMNAIAQLNTKIAKQQEALLKFYLYLCDHNEDGSESLCASDDNPYVSSMEIVR